MSQSPVLAKLCNGPWREGDLRTIDFPDDEPGDIELLLGFLKSGAAKRIPSLESCVPKSNYTVEKPLVFADKLANLFIIGDRYELQSLQGSVMQELEKNDALIKNPRYFMRVARKIFGAHADNNQLYWAYFHRHFGHMAQNFTHPEIVKISDELQESGDDLALNILTAEEDRAKRLIKDKETEIAVTQAKKDSHKMFSDHLKQQNQELAEKWALESAARAQSSMACAQVEEMKFRIRALEAQLAEAQGGALFRKVQDLQARLSLAGKLHSCDHLAHYQCGFEECEKQGQSRM